MWVLIWIYGCYLGGVLAEGKTSMFGQCVAAHQYVMDNEAVCKAVLEQRLGMNDARYMVAHGEGRFVCIQIPKD